VRRARALLALALSLVALALMLSTCGGSDDDDDPQATPPPSEAPSGGGGSAAPPRSGQLPPEFRKCMAARGYEIESPTDIHSAPPEVLQTCFGALHQGGG
jgi:hypothetical protein